MNINQYARLLHSERFITKWRAILFSFFRMRCGNSLSQLSFAYFALFFFPRLTKSIKFQLKLRKQASELHCMLVFSHSLRSRHSSCKSIIAWMESGCKWAISSLLLCFDSFIVSAERGREKDWWRWRRFLCLLFICATIFPRRRANLLIQFIRFQSTSLFHLLLHSFVSQPSLSLARLDPPLSRGGLSD